MKNSKEQGKRFQNKLWLLNKKMERVDLDDLEAVKTSKGNYQRTTKPKHHKGFRSNRIVSWVQ